MLLTRRIGPDDPRPVHAASRTLGQEAFGIPPAAAPTPPLPGPGRWPDGVAMWSTFDTDDTGPDGDPRMAARVRTHDYRSWWGGAPIATVGFAGVTVAAEYRGRGLVEELFRVSLDAHVVQGACLAALYPTAPGIYRPLGFESVATYEQVELPSASLGRVRPAPSVRLRRAREADLPALHATYEAWARHQNGPLTRTGPLFDLPRLLHEVTGATLAEVDDGTGHRVVVGYALWDRGSGSGADAVLEVEDLVALRPDAARSLWHALGSFSTVTGRVRVWTSGSDVARLVLGGVEWEQVKRQPYMMRLIDLPGAIAARDYPVDGATLVRVTGDRMSLVDGLWRITVRDGVGQAERVHGSSSSDAAARLSVPGLGLLYAGALNTANLRLAGHLEGDAEGDRLLDVWFGGHQLHIRDYF